MSKTVEMYVDEESGEDTLEPQEGQMPYIILKDHFGECNPMFNCCDECLELNGFDLDKRMPPVTLEDVQRGNKRWSKSDRREILLLDAESFNAPYAGAGALMPIKGDTALSSFSGKELAESSAIHGDFNQASLNYSGHQNLEVRGAESSRFPYPEAEVTNIVGVKDKAYVTIRYPDTDDHYGYERIMEVDMEDVMLAESFGAEMKDSHLTVSQRVLRAIHDQYPALYEDIEEGTQFPAEELEDTGDYDDAVDIAETMQLVRLLSADIRNASEPIREFYDITKTYPRGVENEMYAESFGAEIDAQENLRLTILSFIDDSWGEEDEEAWRRHLNTYDTDRTKAQVLDKIMAWHDRMQLQSDGIADELDRMEWMLENPDKDYDDYDDYADSFVAEDSQKMEVTFKIQDADYATFYYTTEIPYGLRRHSDEDIVSYIWGDNYELQDGNWFFLPYDWNGVGEHYLAKVMNKTLKAESFGAETVQVYIDEYTEEETLDPTNAIEDIGSYTILKEHFGECHPDSASCCDECLRLNGFDVVSDEEWERIYGKKAESFGAESQKLGIIYRIDRDDKTADILGVLPSYAEGKKAMTYMFKSALEEYSEDSEEDLMSFSDGKKEFAWYESRSKKKKSLDFYHPTGYEDIIIVLREYKIETLTDFYDMINEGKFSAETFNAESFGAESYSESDLHDLIQSIWDGLGEAGRNEHYELFREYFGEGEEMAAEYGKRQRFGNRYVGRDTKGKFISNVSVGRSLKADRRSKSKTPARSGFGHKGDSQKGASGEFKLPTDAKSLVGIGAVLGGLWAYLESKA